MNADEKLADDVLHHSLNLFRYSAAQVTATMKRLKAMEKRLVAELATELTSEPRKSEINAVLKSTDAAGWQGNQSQHSMIKNSLIPLSIITTEAILIQKLNTIMMTWENY